MKLARLCSAHLLVVAATLSGQVVSYEATSFPEEEGWEHINMMRFQADRWIENGRLFQHSEIGFHGPPVQWTQDGYNYYLTPMAGMDRWFMDWSMQTDAPPVLGAVAPAGIVAGGFTGVLYHFTIGNDEVRLIRDADFPIVYAPLKMGIEHVYRLELDNTPPLPTYAFYRDGELIDAGEGEGIYPTADSRITFLGRAAVQPATTQWQYIRAGAIPIAASGDYDSDSLVTSADWYLAAECLTLAGPGIYGGPGRACPEGDETCVNVACQSGKNCSLPLTTTGPGCAFTDMDGDDDVDLADVGAIQNLFTGTALP